MAESPEEPRSPAAIAAAVSICVPAMLGVYPVKLALVGIGFGPAAWVAICWQLASMVTWVVIAVPLLALLRRRTDANGTIGQPPLVLAVDGRVLGPALCIAIGAHAFIIACASEILILGRGRPPFVPLVLDILLLYAPMNVMTLLGLIAAAIFAAELRARHAVTAVRAELERQLNDARTQVIDARTQVIDARTQVIDALALLNGPVRPEPASSIAHPLERITVTSGNRTMLIPVADIDWIEARSYYARLHVGTRDYLVRQSMNALEQQLDPRRFARIHRSTIVNLERVVEIQPYDRRSYVITLRDGHRLMMSRRRRRLLDYLLP